MKFIHAADIHLDSPLTGLAAYPDAPVEQLRTATRRAFSNLCSEAIRRDVDFMVIAGDLYDGTWKDFNTGIYFCKEMGRLDKAGIPVFVLYGNHDAESDMTKTLQLPGNVRTFSSKKCETHFLPALKVALHGQSFKDAATTDNLASKYPAPTDGLFNIGVLHTALEGNAAHANYAPCSVDELHAKGYHYWALGHVHDFRLEDGLSTIVFPGNLQGRSIRETGERGAVLVTVEDARITSVERLIVDVLRWHDLTVDATGCTSMADIVRRVGEVLSAIAAASSASLPGAVRIRLAGRTAAHGELFGMEQQVRAEILALVASIGADLLWLEKVQVRTQDLDDGQALAARADAVADLQTILADAEADVDFMAALQADLMELVAKAPIELQSSVGCFKDIKDGNLASLVREVRPGLLSHLAKVQ